VGQAKARVPLGVGQRDFNGVFRLMFHVELDDIDAVPTGDRGWRERRTRSDDGRQAWRRPCPVGTQCVVCHTGSAEHLRRATDMTTAGRRYAGSLPVGAGRSTHHAVPRGYHSCCIFDDVAAGSGAEVLGWFRVAAFMRSRRPPSWAMSRRRARVYNSELSLMLAQPVLPVRRAASTSGQTETVPRFRSTTPPCERRRGRETRR
jgi:hypothetical protein